MNILIFGGAGFVGRHYVNFFLGKKYKIEVVDNIVPLSGGQHPKKWKLFNPYKYEKNFKFINQDCRDYFQKNVKNTYDLVINLAAIVGGREVIEYNPLAVAEDLEIDTAFWRWSVRNKKKIKHIITYSSSAAYPIDLQRKNNFRLLKESDINFKKKYFGKPDLSYGWAKLNNEYLGSLAFEKYGIKNTIFRPFSGYGSDQDLSYPFPSIIKRAIKHNTNNKFIVWGSGFQSRDFIHIDDIIRGSIIISKKIKNGNAINLSSGKFISFINLSKLILKNLGKDHVRVCGNSKKPEGVFARGGSTSLQKKLKFFPKITIDKGIRLAINYFKNHQHL
jgi:nucleoside-diphosphate-sugar epimerase